MGWRWAMGSAELLRCSKGHAAYVPLVGAHMDGDNLGNSWEVNGFMGGSGFEKGGGKGIGFDKMDVFFPCILIYGYDRYVQISWIYGYLWTVFVLCWSHLDLVTLMVKLLKLVVWIDPATTNYTHVVSGGFQVSTTFVDTMFNSCSGRRAKLSMFLISDYCVLCFRFFVVFQFEQWK